MRLVETMRPRTILYVGAFGIASVLLGFGSKYLERVPDIKRVQVDRQFKTDSTTGLKLEFMCTEEEVRNLLCERPENVTSLSFYHLNGNAADWSLPLTTYSGDQRHCLAGECKPLDLGVVSTAVRASQSLAYLSSIPQTGL